MHENEGARVVLHPTLAALYIVLDRNENLGNINRSHPDLIQHELYDPDVEFPHDLSDLLPPTADRWWDHLGKLELLRFPHISTYNL